MLPLVARPEISDDLRRLPPALIPVLRAFLPKLRADPIGISRPLGYRPGVGNLGDCRKAYIDVPHGAGPPAYRIVLRLVPSENEPTGIEIVSIGVRRDLEVYRTAAARLDRS